MIFNGRIKLRAFFKKRSYYGRYGGLVRYGLDSRFLVLLIEFLRLFSLWRVLGAECNRQNY